MRENKHQLIGLCVCVCVREFQVIPIDGINALVWWVDVADKLLHRKQVSCNAIVLL